MIDQIAVYLLIVNILTAYLFWLDWRFERARLGVGKIPEGVFLIFAFAGGALSLCLMQRILRHRLYRRKFSARCKLYMMGHMSLVIMNVPAVLNNFIA